MEAIKFDYTGPMCAVFTAFSNDSKRTIRYDSIDRYAEWLKQQNVNGVLVNGTNGEGVCQRVDERKRNVEEWIKACRNHDLKCMVQIGGTAIGTVYDLAEHAEEAGADAVLCLPELFFKPTCEEDLVDYLKKVAEHCPTRPLFFYHFPMWTKVNLWMPRFCDLADEQIPSFNGIKFSHFDLSECIACLKTNRKIFLGANTTLLGGLVQGIDSCITGCLNVYPELVLQIFAAVKENRLEDAQLAQQELADKLDALPAGLKDEFNSMNPEFACGPSRKPMLNKNKQNPTRKW